MVWWHDPGSRISGKCTKCCLWQPRVQGVTRLPWSLVGNMVLSLCGLQAWFSNSLGDFAIYSISFTEIIFCFNHLELVSGAYDHKPWLKQMTLGSIAPWFLFFFLMAIWWALTDYGKKITGTITWVSLYTLLFQLYCSSFTSGKTKTQRVLPEVSKQIGIQIWP